MQDMQHLLGKDIYYQPTHCRHESFREGRVIRVEELVITIDRRKGRKTAKEIWPAWALTIISNVQKEG